MMDLEGSVPTENYIYTPLNSENFEIRLLKLAFSVDDLLGQANDKPLRGSLETYSLPLSKLDFGQRFIKSTQLPAINALSYVWGDPSRTHEIIVDNKIIRITANLYGALRDLMAGALWGMSIWADAICINQDDLAERSSQVLLMREIYHCAAEVNIWLGPSSENGRKAMKFIGDLTGEYGPDLIEKQSTENSSSVEVALAKYVVLPSLKLLQKGYAFGQTVGEMGELFTAAANDDKANMIVDRSGDLSLHQDTIKRLIKWKPRARHWANCQNEDFGKMARWIDEYIIEKYDWFSRMWVVQEVGTADTAAIIFAGSSVDFEEFLRGCCYLHYTLNCPLRNMRKLIGLEKIRQGWNDSQRHPLRDLIRECRYRKATDPRDKIFALLGLMGDKMNPFLQPDYTKTVSQVFASTTLHFMTQSCSLNPICGWQRTHSLEELPSWVPDYSLDQERTATPLVSIDGTENIFNASGSQNKAKIPSTDDVTSSKYNWRELGVTSLCIDSVSLLSKTDSPNSSFGDTEKTWLSTISGANHLVPAVEEVKPALYAISEIIRKYNVFWNTIQDILQAGNSAGHGPQGSELTLISNTHLELGTTHTLALKHKEIPHAKQMNIALLKGRPHVVDAYIYSLFNGKISAERRLTQEELEHILDLDIPTELKETGPQNIQDVTDICRTLIAGMTGRRIAVTKGGYIGALPEETQTGDLVCVLYGCSVPVVLRKLEGVDQSYKFVGECYLHGFMDAEAIAMHRKGLLDAEDITLV